MVKLNIGCGTDIKEGFINVDKYAFPQNNVFNWDIEKRWPLENSSVSFVWAHHVLEHVEDLDFVMRQLHRVCENGATIDIVVPLAHTLWDVANPTHKIRFNHKTFEYFSLDHIFPDLGLFQHFKIISQHIEREPDEWFEGISWIVANLHVILKVVKE